ncbi:hypothetical protein BDV59DRAFT_60613 [Aspergillus ambiguus]|uniref:uncharacterized protein n=1 Tax=Aspergillus ambiguus TaxID=176160 RepID=UPI003CCC9E0E
MLVSPMPPQTSLHYPRPPPPSSSSADDKDASSHTVITSTLPSPSSASHSNMACPLATSTTPAHRRPAVASRPKLTLQTSSLPRTFGSSSTGLSLSLAGGATASPTVRNTFKNAYDVPLPSSATVSPSKSVTNRFSKPSSPYTTNNPYQLPLGLKSILRNSPLEPTTRRQSISMATGTPNGLQAPRRVFFPAKKQVSYRQPLEEEIHTVRYTARHSDLAAEPDPEPREAGSDEDSDSNSSLTLSDTSTSEDDVGGERLERKKRKHQSANKQVRAVALMDRLDGDDYSSDSATPQTPCQARSKRRCEWRWTLGPLEVRGGPNASREQTKTDLPDDGGGLPSCNSSDNSPAETPSPSSSMLSEVPQPTTIGEIGRVHSREAQ